MPGSVSPYWAYPRPRGGASRRIGVPASSYGLSPPARGSPLLKVLDHVRDGPIPARAGEPSSWTPLSEWVRAYPRPRGGAESRPAEEHDPAGLSPPARGSPDRRPTRPRRLGPIPARAGEPRFASWSSRSDRAYPRPRGGAAPVSTGTAGLNGLSPPARGSRPRAVLNYIHVRPIPARAGEPSGPEPSPCTWEAYPRPRGGACHVSGLATCLGGLSPPARGSRSSAETLSAMVRPIPARAGEPARDPGGHVPNGAYPRPRGGACSTGHRPVTQRGLSPPARGSRDPASNHFTILGPIPARAGEPNCGTLARPGRRAYPRPRGGAP